MTSPATILTGCRRATSMAAASRDKADASGGAQASSHAQGLLILEVDGIEIDAESAGDVRQLGRRRHVRAAYLGRETQAGG